MLCLAGIHLNYNTGSVFVNDELQNDKVRSKPHPLSHSWNHHNNKVQNTFPCQVPAYDCSGSVHLCSSAYNTWSEKNRANRKQKEKKEKKYLLLCDGFSFEGGRSNKVVSKSDCPPDVSQIHSFYVINLKKKIKKIKAFCIEMFKTHPSWM